MQQKQSRALTFIFLTVLIDCIGVGIIIPVSPKLIQQLGNCTVSDASVYGSWMIFAYAIMQFLFAPVLGGLSDRYGRRPILLISLFGLGIDYLLMALAPSLTLLFVGRIVAGLCGASFTTASAYIADVSTPEKKAQNFGLIGAAFGIGFTLGPSIGGLLGEYSLRAPFYGAAILSLINFAYGYFILPESLKPENRRPFDLKRANPLGTLVNLFQYKQILLLILCLFLLYIAGSAAQTTWTYFTIEKFKWSEGLIGASITFVGITVGLVQGGLIRYTLPKLGIKKSIYIGLFFYALGLLLFAFAWQGWMMFAFMIPYALGGIAMPAIQSLVSSQVPPNEQGELQGGITSVTSIAMVIGPVVMGYLFNAFTQKNAAVYFPGASFLLGAVLCFITVFIAAIALKRTKQE